MVQQKRMRVFALVISGHIALFIETKVRLGLVHNAQKDCGHHITFTRDSIPYHQSSHGCDNTEN